MNAFMCCVGAEGSVVGRDIEWTATVCRLMHVIKLSEWMLQNIQTVSQVVTV